MNGLGFSSGDQGTLLNVAGSLPLPPLLYNPLLPCLINISASAGNLPFQ